ncbi:MAG: DNA-binding protein [Clostridiaceae bacterium]|nr:DNA-binding protein [Clostridiaceae bacterium]
MNYDFLREEYPKTISMEQLYHICHISKRKALWLLEHGVIPCQDSGKQTRRFRILLEDAIDFLHNRDAGELDAVIPHGTFSSGSHREPYTYLDSEALFSLSIERWQDAPDMLTVKQAEALCGYGTTTMNRWFQLGHVRGVTYYGVNLISKESLAEYLASPEGQRISIKSEAHRLLLEKFCTEQKNSGMAFGSMSL